MAADPTPARAGSAPLRKRSVVVTELVVLVLAVVVPALVIGVSKGFSHDEPTPGAAPAVLGLALAAPLVLLRCRWPLPLLAAAVGGSVMLMATTGERTPLLIAVVILLFTVASTHDRRTAVLAGVVTAVVLYVTAAIRIDEAALGPDGLAAIAWSLLAVAAGDAVRTRRAYVAAVEERALRAERSKEEEARRRVAEERLRIARELHDVVAHRLAVINVQAAAASQLLTSDPPRAAESMEHVRASAAEVLQELAGVLHVLRADDEASGTASPRHPAPTVVELHDLDPLVAGFGAAGLVVTTEITDVAAPAAGSPLPESVGVVTYRVVQEALTNAHRHGTGTAALVLERRPEALHVTVTNPVALAPPTTGTGLGLVGMRERVEAVGGTLRAGPAPAAGGDPRWSVDVEIPLTFDQAARSARP